MKTVTIVAAFHKERPENALPYYTLYKFYASYRDGAIVELSHGEKVFPTFQEMYDTILRVCKNNNLHVKYYTDFGARFYNILWCDSDGTLSKYAYHVNDKG